MRYKFFCKGCSKAFMAAPCVLEYHVPDGTEKIPPRVCPFSAVPEQANWRMSPAENAESAVTSNNTRMAAKAQICPYCKGTGYIGPDGDMVVEQKCAGCGGTGKLRHA